MDHTPLLLRIVAALEPFDVPAMSATVLVRRLDNLTALKREILETINAPPDPTDHTALLREVAQQIEMFSRLGMTGIGHRLGDLANLGDKITAALDNPKPEDTA